VKGYRGLGALALIATLATMAVVLLSGVPPAEGSTLSAGARGWLLTRRYLEARGASTQLVDEPFAKPMRRGTLVLVFPWQSLPFEEDLNAGLSQHLERGGDVLVAYSGRLFSIGEQRIASDLGFEMEDLKGRPSLVPWRFWREAARKWPLRSAAELETELQVQVPMPSAVPKAPAGARLLLEGPDRAAAFSYGRARGRVYVVPAEALSNALLREGDHLTLLELLRAELRQPWMFDEYHHGLRAPSVVNQAENGLPMDAFLLQILFVYAAVLLARVRRFGPAWSDPPVLRSSARAFLVGLGALHHRLGHHAVGARKLLARAREMDARLRLTDDELPVVKGADADGFLETAKALARAQQGGER